MRPGRTHALVEKKGRDQFFYRNVKQPDNKSKIKTATAQEEKHSLEKEERKEEIAKAHKESRRNVCAAVRSRKNGSKPRQKEQQFVTELKCSNLLLFCFGCDQYTLLWGVIARSGSAKHLVNSAKGKGNQRVWTTASVKRHSRRPCVSH